MFERLLELMRATPTTGDPRADLLELRHARRTWATERPDRYTAMMRFSGPHAAARSPEGLARWPSPPLSSPHCCGQPGGASRAPCDASAGVRLELAATAKAAAKSAADHRPRYLAIFPLKLHDPRVSCP